MKRKEITQFSLGGILLAFFVLYTLSLTFIEVQPIGPNGSSVAYASINKAVHKLFGVNMTIYNITVRRKIERAEEAARMNFILLACGMK